MDKEDVTYMDNIPVYVMESHTVIIKNKILPFVTVWINLETMMLSEMSHRERLYIIIYMKNLKQRECI